MYARNAASPRPITVGQIILIADGTVQTTGVSAKVRKDGGTWTAASGSTSVEEGVWSYTPTQGETDCEALEVLVYKAGCYQAFQEVITTAVSTFGKVQAKTVDDKTGYSLTAGTGLGNQTANITGNLSGSVGSVTSPVTAGTVTDKDGYKLSTAGNTAVVDSLFGRAPTKATQHTVERIFWNNDRTSIVNDGEVVANVANTAQSFETTLTGMTDKYNDSLIQFTSGALEGESNSVASMDAAGVVTFHDAFTAVPSGADEFIVRPESNHSPEEIAAAVETLLSMTTRSELSSAPAANASLADKLTWLAQLARNKMQSTGSSQTLYADDETTVVATFAVSDDGTTATRGEAI